MFELGCVFKFELELLYFSRGQRKAGSYLQ